MDTSEQYIKMCDCEEIQEQCKFNEGDYTAREDKLGIGSCIKDIYCSNCSEKKITDKVWLPRQDQIQEMLGIKTAEGFRNMVDDMFYTRDGGLYDTMNDRWFVEEIKTPEQLWLAFYMYEKHQKIWNGNNWIKSEKE